MGVTNQKYRGKAYVSHGPKCECLACRELSACAARIVQRDPHVRLGQLEPAYRAFVHFHQTGKMLVRSPWSDEMVEVAAQ